MKKAKLMKRFLSLLLVISMVLSCAPYTAEAAEVEAKWGTSASRLTNSGTYLDAIKAATAANSRIKYIQLQSTVYLTQGYDVSSGTFTIDLNDHQLRNRDSVLVVQSGANVTVTDTSAGGGGQMLLEDPNHEQPCLGANGGVLTIEEGTFISLTGEDAAVWGMPGSTITINGGTFYTRTGPFVVRNAGNLIINGGTFNAAYDYFLATGEQGEAGSVTTINGGTYNGASDATRVMYTSGKVDFSGYTEDLNNAVIKVEKLYDEPVDITLPEKAVFYNTATKELSNEINSNGTYKIKIGNHKVMFDANGGTGTMEPVMTTDRFVLPECTFIPPEKKVFNCWTTAPNGGNAYFPGTEIGIGTDEITFYANWIECQVKWGTDSNNLTKGGTFIEAVTAAKAQNSTVGYIQLQQDIFLSQWQIFDRGNFVLDFNGYTITTQNSGIQFDNVYEESMNVTLTDTSESGNGGINAEYGMGFSTSRAGANVTIDGGKYQANNQNAFHIGSGAKAIINEGASFSSSSYTLIENYGGSLTINGGDFKGENWSLVSSREGATTIINGGTYSCNEGYEHIHYGSGVLDLTGLGNKAKGLRMYVGEGMSESNIIRIPEGMAYWDIYNEEVVSIPAANSCYTICGANGELPEPGEGETPEGDVIWGTDIDHLTDGGTLEDAANAMNRTDSSIEYIQICKDISVDTYVRFERGDFIFDLNGHTISLNDNGIGFNSVSEKLNVIITDTSADMDGKIQAETTIPLHVGSANTNLTIDKGTVISNQHSVLFIAEGAEVTINESAKLICKAEQYLCDSFGTLTINGGEFVGEKSSLLYGREQATTIINGGKFTRLDKNADYVYTGGTLDLTGYGDDAVGFKILTYADKENVLLPEGFFWFTSEGEITETFEVLGYYTAGKKVDGKVKWGTDRAHLTEEGTMEEALAAATQVGSQVGYVQLQEDMIIGYKMDINAGRFTIDYNGHTVTSRNGGFNLTDDAAVTFTDRTQQGKFIYESGGTPFEINAAIAIFDGGNYEANTSSNTQLIYNYPGANVTIKNGFSYYSEECPVIINVGRAVIDDDVSMKCPSGALMLNAGELVVYEGDFTARDAIMVTMGGTATIHGGEFVTTGDESYTFLNYGGIIDLSEMDEEAAGLTCYYVELSADVILPEGLAFQLADGSSEPIYELTEMGIYKIVQIAPSIQGVKDEKTYYTTQKVVIEDDDLATVTVNGEQVYPAASTYARRSTMARAAAAVEIILEGNKDATYEIVATDNAGNVSEKVVEMKPISELAKELEAENVEDAEKTINKIVKKELANATEEEKKAIEELAEKVEEAGKPSVPLKFASASLTLYDNIAVNFKVDSSLFGENAYENPYIICEFNGEEIVVDEYYTDAKGTRYIFDFTNIAPHQMNDEITAKVYAEYNGVEYVSEPLTYSVKQYAYNMLNKYPAETYTDSLYVKLRTLLVDLLNYGGQSQIYTNTDTNNLVNGALTDAQKALGTTGTREYVSVTNAAFETIENPTVIWKGAGLNLKDRVEIRVKLKADSINDLVIKVRSQSGYEWEIDASKFEDNTKVDANTYYAYFSGLNAGQMSEPVYFTVYDGETPVSNTLCYSVESYAASKVNGTDQALSEIVKAMMNYGDSAKNYISQ